MKPKGYWRERGDKRRRMKRAYEAYYDRIDAVRARARQWNIVLTHDLDIDRDGHVTVGGITLPDDLTPTYLRAAIKAAASVAERARAAATPSPGTEEKHDPRGNDRSR